ncbi:MAG: glycerol-3-phosphate 1-O-acyltransferase PlsY [Tissierellia bacterium]|nr:glycerol-3-phosphate 1-O-acyltransferase PlsY [Tissierellia bacterium]
MINYIGLAIVSYFIGCFSFAILVGKLAKNIDIRKHGSGNAGTTNAIRVLGASYGVLVFIGDFGKAFLAAWLGNRLGGYLGVAIAAFYVVLGHDFPIFHKFQGGKGIACTVGICAFINPLMTLISFIFCFGIGLAIGYISLGSLLFLTAVPIGAIIYYWPANIELIIVAFLISGLGFYRHGENIKRLKNGTENKIWRKK